jgi:predicted permease
VLQHLRADIRYALRGLRRSPLFTLIAVASFAIGIGFNTALFTLVDTVLFRPLPVDRPDRLVDMYTSGDDSMPFATSSYPDYLDFRSGNDVFVDMLGYSASLNALKVGDRSRLAIGETVTGSYFPLLGVKAAAGRTLQPEDDRAGAPRAAMISYRLWTREFGGSAAAVGQTLRIHNQLYTIVGVAPRTFTGMVPLLAPEVWTPMAYVDDVEPAGIISVVPSPSGNTRLERRGTRWMFVKGRLKPNATIDQAGANLRLIAKRLQDAYGQTNKDRSVNVLPASSVHIHPMADRTLMPIALGLMVVFGLVLLIACANVASMLLARASGRQKEIGIRLAIGASRARLVQQLVTESVVLAGLGAAAGAALAWVTMRAIANVRLPIPIPLSFEMHMDTRVLWFTLAVTFVAAVAAGLVPALKATRPNLVTELKGETARADTAGRRWTLRDGLVAAQIAITLVLLVSAGLLTRSLFAAQKVKIGFEPAGLAIVSTDLGLIGYDATRAKGFYERALERVKAIPGVESAALAERLPFSINYNETQVFLPDRQQPNDKGATIDVARVSAEYFATLGVPIVQGRNFSSVDTPTSPKTAIVNEAFARKYWPHDDPLGKHFRVRTFDGPQYEIVGVSADYKVSTVGEASTPYIHYAVSQQPDAGEEIMARTHGDAAVVLNAMRRELLAIDPNVLFIDQQTMEAQVATTLMPARAGAISVSAVGGVAMLLAAVGLYGVIAYAVSRRTREIGIRMALGANRGTVVSMIVGDGMRLAAIGGAVGVVLAAGAAKAVTGALYGVSFLDPLAWFGAVATLLVVAVLANLAPALRASRVSPSLALRSE